MQETRCVAWRTVDGITPERSAFVADHAVFPTYWRMKLIENFGPGHSLTSVAVRAPAHGVLLWFSVGVQDTEEKESGDSRWAFAFSVLTPFSYHCGVHLLWRTLRGDRGQDAV